MNKLKLQLQIMVTGACGWRGVGWGEGEVTLLAQSAARYELINLKIIVKIESAFKHVHMSFA